MVKKRTLLLFAAIVWAIAGFNVLRIGIISFEDNVSLLLILLSIIVFALFFIMFRKLVNKNEIRIRKYKEEKQLFIHFFDLKSFIIMIVMITLGVVIRNFELWPLYVISFFYTGLGSALFSAGILFFLKFIYYNKTQ